MQATRIFEFGTHRGVSTTQLPPTCRSKGRSSPWTCPAAIPARHSKWTTPPKTKWLISRSRRLIPESLRKKITFLEQDSAKFDPAPYAESIDLIFVDAAHTGNTC